MTYEREFRSWIQVSWLVTKGRGKGGSACVTFSTFFSLRSLGFFLVDVNDDEPLFVIDKHQE